MVFEDDAEANIEFVRTHLKNLPSLDDYQLRMYRKLLVTDRSASDRPHDVVCMLDSMHGTSPKP